ncbi:MAG TPA: protein jag [Firmicutes bacterium]|jgi:spoIIIJ-associated protein|nr:protein jag [Bacillota bacterium]
MKSVQKSARTVDEAIEAAIQELGVSREEVEVTVLEEGNKGFFGLLGGKLASVLVTVKEPEIAEADAQVEQTEKVAKAKQFLEGVLERLEVDAEVHETAQEDGTILLEITGENLGLLIGRRGQTLDALQYLTSVVTNKGGADWMRIVLDAAGYRKRREQTLRQLALRMADRAKKQQKRVYLEPMSALERRIVHMALAEDTGIETHSEGEDPNRRIVISPKQR